MRKWHQMALREIEAIQARLPADVAESAARVPVYFDDAPFTDDDDLLGFFEGASLRDGPPMHSDDLPRIAVFVQRLLEMCEGNAEEFCEEVRITYLHELGHYLGWDEEEVAARGL